MNKPKYTYFWMAVTVKNEDGLYAFPMRVSEYDNLAWKLECIANLKYANLMPTKKRAIEVTDFYNECYKKTGTYAY